MAKTKTVIVALCGLTSACADHFYSDPLGRFHLETPMSMQVGGTTEAVTLEPGNETVVTIDSVTTDAADLDAYVASALDGPALAHGDHDDRIIGGLPARRLEFRGGIDLGDGLPVFANLVAFMIQDGATIYRLTCTGPDGPFESFCIGSFDDMAETFAIGAAP